MAKKKPKNNTERQKNLQPTPKQYEKIGRILEAIVVKGFVDKKRLMWVSFLRGIAQGFGIFIGGTIIVALVLWILGLLGEIPLIGDLFESTAETIQ